YLCDEICSFDGCDLCQYRHHCDSTCIGLCKTSDPCDPNPCFNNQTCEQKPQGSAHCVPGVDPKCMEKAQRGTCDFYQCFDEKTQCGAGGYALKFGTKYCNRFSYFYSNFTSGGQAMIDCVRHCLTRFLLNYYEMPNSDCSAIESAAFDSHVNCYVGCNFCDEWNDNKKALYNVYDMEHRAILLALFASILSSCYCQFDQARIDLPKGGRYVCPYCIYCGYQYICDGTCSYDGCDLCQYRHHCDSTCNGLCKTPADPCDPNPCPNNQTCEQKPQGSAHCVPGVDPKCMEKAQRGTCDFYQCFDEKTQCGAGGYALKFGATYCNRFGDYYSNFTSGGQKMIDCVRHCLTRFLLKYYEMPNGDCSAIESAAFDSHVNCYVSCNFCDVWNDNKKALYNVYELRDIALSPTIWSQMAEVGVTCLLPSVG
ncbi:hypothetical protein MAR_028624, partial [Mya arenaria]